MKDMTVGNEGKLIFYFALPMLFGNVFQQMYNVVDSVIVGNYIGKNALAAVGASFPVIFVLISLIVGISSGSTIIISQYFGAKDYKKVKATMDTMFIFLFFASLTITALGLLFSRNIFEMMDLPKEILPEAIIYFNIFISGAVLLFGYNGVSAALRGMGDSKTPLYFLIISTILNIILVMLFVVVFHWGIAGTAVATVIAQGVAFLISVIYLNKYHTIIKFSIKDFTFDKEIFIKSIKIGIPSGLQQTFVAIGMMALIRIVNGFGTDAIAAYSVAGRIDSFAIMPAMNFSMALSSFVGQNIGANKTERVKKGFRATMLMTGAVAIFITIFAVIFGETIMGLFTNDQNVIKIGESYLVIVSSFYIVFSFMFVVGGVLRGAGDTLIPMFITLLSLWLLRVPLSWWFSRSYGTDGIWWGIPIAWIFGFVMSYAYYLTGRWKRKAIIKRPVVQIEEPLVE
ncbi:MAG: MATE family efflux transporter [Bacteroidetes bacterium]|nr:MATE family efflux transporter [Bacteroidota bacterium]